MYDRFSDHSRTALGLARQEAGGHGHEYIGPEHMLLGLMGEGSGASTSVLDNLGVDLARVRLEVETLMGEESAVSSSGELPFTPGAKAVLELSLEEAAKFGHTYIGSEHLLLGIIREKEGIGAQVLRAEGVTIEDARREVLAILAKDP